MTDEQFTALLSILERIAVAVEPRQRPQNPNSPAVRATIEQIVKDEIEKQKPKP